MKTKAAWRIPLKSIANSCRLNRRTSRFHQRSLVFRLRVLDATGVERVFDLLVDIAWERVAVVKDAAVVDALFRDQGSCRVVLDEFFKQAERFGRFLAHNPVLRADSHFEFLRIGDENEV